MRNNISDSAWNLAAHRLFCRLYHLSAQRGNTDYFTIRVILEGMDERYDALYGKIEVKEFLELLCPYQGKELIKSANIHTSGSLLVRKGLEVGYRVATPETGSLVRALVEGFPRN